MAPWTGSPPSQQFTRTDGTRTGDDIYQQQAAAPVDIEPVLMDIEATDVKDGLNVCLKKDGGNTASANIPMGGFTLTNIANAAARTSPASFAQLQDNKGQYVATVGGTANAITLTPSPAITAYAAGQRFSFFATNSNTAATTVNVSGVGAVSIAGAVGGEIGAGQFTEVVHNGTDFTLIRQGTPIGSLVDYAGAAAPAGWLLCYGQAISRTTYAALFSVLSTTYGVGDGSTTFNLPDLRGRVVAGQDDMGGSSANRLTNQTGGLDGDTLGATGGAETHTLTEAQLAAHSHAAGTLAAASDGAHTHSYTRYNFQFAADLGSGGANTWAGDSSQSTSSDGSHTHTVSGSTASAGSGSAHNNVQPTIILNKIIFAGV